MIEHRHKNLLGVIELIGDFVLRFRKIILWLGAAMGMMVMVLALGVFALHSAINVFVAQYHDNNMMADLADLPPPEPKLESGSSLITPAVPGPDIDLEELVKDHLNPVASERPADKVAADSSPSNADPESTLGDLTVVVDQAAVTVSPVAKVVQVTQPFVAGNLSIPEIELDQEIEPVPFANNSWDVDDLGNGVGLLEQTGTRPGDPRSMVFAGHVSTEWSFLGPFAHLSRLKEGSEIIYTLGDEIHIYEVTKMQRILPSQGGLLFQDDPEKILLLTCIGYEADSESYAERLLIEAKRVDVKLADELTFSQ